MGMFIPDIIKFTPEAEEAYRHNGLSPFEKGRLAVPGYKGRIKLTIPAARRLIEVAETLSEPEREALKERLRAARPLPDDADQVC